MTLGHFLRASRTPSAIARVGYNYLEHAGIFGPNYYFGLEWRGFGCNSRKKEMSWCSTLEGSRPRIRYSLERTQWAVVQMAQSTKVSVAYANRNGRQWNRNVNSLDNDNVWNRENRLVVRNSRLSPINVLVAREFSFQDSFSIPPAFCLPPRDTLRSVRIVNPSTFSFPNQ